MTHTNANFIQKTTNNKITQIQQKKLINQHEKTTVQMCQFFQI